MVKVELDLSKSVHENANVYFSKSKKLKAKLPGIEKTLEKTKEELETISQKQVEHQKKQEKQQLLKEHLPKSWYDKFRYTLTSSGKLVVLGKDAGTNELLIKKHLEENDIVFHTSAPGSPFAIVKDATTKASHSTSSPNLNLTRDELEEVGQVVCAFSSQWKRGFGTADCFWVYPDQVTKKAQSGEFIGRGSFMIYGKKNELKNIVLKLALGVRVHTIKSKEGEEFKYEELFSASPKAISKYCNTRYILLEPGQDNYKKLGKEIKKKLNTSIDNLPKIIPNGCRIVKK